MGYNFFSYIWIIIPYLGKQKSLFIKKISQVKTFKKEIFNEPL